MDYTFISKSGLSLDRIRNFILVADAGSVSRAAQADNNQQSMFSRQIKDLENFFGTELFHRKGRTIELTDSGSRLLCIAKVFLASLEDFAEECQLDQRDLRIAAGDSFIQWLFMPQLMDLRAATNNANLTFKNLNTKGSFQGLLNGDIHLALTRKPTHPEIRSVRIGEVTYRLFLPNGFEPKGTQLADVLGELPLAGMEGNGHFQQSMESLIRVKGLFVSYAVRCPSFPIMAKAVESLSIGAVLPAIAANSLNNSAYLDLEELENLAYDLYLSWHSKQEAINPALKKDADAIARILGESLSRSCAGRRPARWGSARPSP